MLKNKVLIVGGGFGGLNTALSLKKADFDILLLDKTNHHLFQPLLYQVATAALSSSNIATPIREVLRKEDKVSVMMSDVIRIEKEKNQIVTADDKVYPFEYLVLAPGASHAYFGHDQWEEFAPGLKTLEDAITIRERILLSYELAEKCHDDAEIKKLLRFIVIGGGPTGVEMAGAIAEIARQAMRNNFRNIKPELSEIYLIEGIDHILPSYPESLSARAQRDLEKLGVTVLTKTKVTNITSHGVQCGDTFLETPNIIWAAGNQASPLLKTLDIDLDKQGRALVENDLSIVGFPNIFVIGDAAHFEDKNGEPLPGIAPVALQQSKYVAKIIKNNISKNDRKPFKYFDKGSMATIGKAHAVAVIGKLKFGGFIAWLAWCLIHIVYLIRFKNRIIVMTQWIFWYFTGERNVRLITKPIEEEKT